MTKRPWTKMVDPIVQKCRLSASLDMNTSFNPEGANALSDLMLKMATALDDQLEEGRTLSVPSPNRQGEA